MPHFQAGLMDPGNFVNRNEELRSIVQRIKAATSGTGSGHKHYVLSAQRRLGKTQLLKAVIRELSQHKIPAAHMEVQSVGSPEEFMTRLGDQVNELDRSFSRRIKKGLQPIMRIRPNIEVNPAEGTAKISGSLAKEQWKRLGDLVFDRLAQMRPPAMIVLDEMGFVRKMTGSAREKGQFLAYIREKLGQTPAVFVLCGSQNIFQILKEEDPDNFGAWSNIFDRIPLRPFTYEQLAEDLYKPNIRDEGLQIEAKDIEPVCRFVFAVTGGHPNMAQTIGERLQDKFTDAPHISREDLGRFFNDLLPELVFKDALGTIKSLVDQEAFGSHHKSYKALLKAIAIHPDPPALESFLASRGDGEETEAMIGLLEEMEYLEITPDDKIRFTSPFLKDNLAPIEQRKDIKEQWARQWQDCVSS